MTFPIGLRQNEGFIAFFYVKKYLLRLSSNINIFKSGLILKSFYIRCVVYVKLSSKFEWMPRWSLAWFITQMLTLQLQRNNLYMDNFLSILRSIGAARLAMLIVSVIMLIGLMSMVVLKSGGPSDSLLYGGIDPQESGRIVERLAQMNVPYSVRGNAIYTHQTRVDELRLKLAAEGLVGTSVNGYEIFDKSSGFGTTSLVQNINARRALEGELSRTIQSMPAVQSARVHLVMPKRKIFSREQITPTASVTLNLGSRVLSEEQIQGITHLVSAAVPRLSPDNVTVVDNRGNMLSSGNKSQANKMNLQSKIQYQVESEYEDALRTMLEKIVGVGKANVKVTAQMTFDRVEEHSELYDPQTQVVRSEQRSEDILESHNNTGSGTVGASANIPGQEAGKSGGSGSSENRTTSGETINYEISKTIKKHIKEGGEIERLSVAVLVEGKYIDENGTTRYEPNSKQDLQKIERLVKSAIGYDEKRSDIVEIVDMDFAQVEPEAVEEEPLLSKEDYFAIAEYALMMIAIFLLVFMIIKPILKATISEGGGSSQVDEAIAGSGGSGPMRAAAPPIMGADGQPIPQSNIPAAAMRSTGSEALSGEGAMIDLAQVEGKVRESTVNLVLDIVKEHPEESSNILRGWLSGEAAPTPPEGGV